MGEDDRPSVKGSLYVTLYQWLPSSLRRFAPWIQLLLLVVTSCLLPRIGSFNTTPYNRYALLCDHDPRILTDKDIGVEHTGLICGPIIPQYGLERFRAFCDRVHGQYRDEKDYTGPNSCIIKMSIEELDRNLSGACSGRIFTSRDNYPRINGGVDIEITSLTREATETTEQDTQIYTTGPVYFYKWIITGMQVCREHGTHDIAAGLVRSLKSDDRQGSSNATQRIRVLYASSWRHLRLGTVDLGLENRDIPCSIDPSYVQN